MAAHGTPDLQSILATLSQYTSQPPIQDSGHEQPLNVSQNESLQAALERLSRGQASAPTAIPPPTAPSIHDPRPRPPIQNGPTPKPVDPACITSWQEGLRCVTKIAAQNAHFAGAIRKMMEEQRRHEMLWYRERQALKQTQLARVGSSAKALSIFQSLGNGNMGSPAPATPEVNLASELAAYDRKVYAAQRNMEIAMTAELKALGVPFFGTDPSLVVPDTNDSSGEWPPERQKRCVAESELLGLRRKMVDHLEDLYRD